MPRISKKQFQEQVKKLPVKERALMVFNLTAKRLMGKPDKMETEKKRWISQTIDNSKDFQIMRDIFSVYNDITAKRLHLSYYAEMIKSINRLYGVLSLRLYLVKYVRFTNEGKNNEIIDAFNNQVKQEIQKIIDTEALLPKNGEDYKKVIQVINEMIEQTRENLRGIATDARALTDAVKEYAKENGIELPDDIKFMLESIEQVYNMNEIIFINLMGGGAVLYNEIQVPEGSKIKLGNTNKAF